MRRAFSCSSGGKGKGFSGVENDLFVDPKTSMLFGDARQSLLDLGLQVKEASSGFGRKPTYSLQFRRILIMAGQADEDSGTRPSHFDSKRTRLAS